MHPLTYDYFVYMPCSPLREVEICRVRRYGGWRGGGGGGLGGGGGVGGSL